MKVSENELSVDDIQSIRDAVRERRPVNFYCYTLTLEQKKRFQKILEVFLEECDEAYLFNCLSYCLFELLDNASKANAKRIFFKEQHLNINNQADYENGMKNFKANLSDNTKHYKDELEAGLLQVHLELSANDVISLAVSNNTKITEAEYKRIQDKIEKTKGYQNVADAFSDIDQTEGSGLGIITVVIMLRKLGLNTSNLKFSVTEDETVATIEIPKHMIADLDDLESL
ncbi:MAG: hypothetical protein J6X78_08075 [Treponema sp.]|nr:hypothetical protein [Treponema sp.]